MDRKIEPKDRRPLYYGLGLLAIVGIVLLVWMMSDTSTSYTLDGQRIRTATVSRGVYEDFIPLRASVEPERTVYLDAIEGGRVERVLVEEGAIVEQEQPILELSNTSLQLDVIAREAEVSEQLNNLRNTQLAIDQNRLSLKSELIEIDYQIARLTRLVKRFEELEGNQFISKNEYENATDELDYWKSRRVVTRESQAQDERIRLAQIEQLEASVEQLEKNLQLARSNLDNLLVRAPRAGQLTSLNAEIGESKARGERLGQIDDIDRFKAVALVNEFYLNRVRIGQRAELEFNGDRYELEVSKIYPEVQASQFEVDLRFTGNAPADVRRGQTLQIRLVLGDIAEEATLLANGPFLNDTGGAWVFVLTPDRKIATRRDVQLGRRNPNSIEVLGGLIEGDEVIISSYQSFLSVDRLFIDR
ncbi:MAG: HlyD family efflux transporter periplasmic adaptor subunit [Gammaproteobacteria bacterium]|nr:HlyD family efflux transporter periplasmic adaptor subunit [Gammaproteobacteria bacterium]